MAAERPVVAASAGIIHPWLAELAHQVEAPEAGILGTLFVSAAYCGLATVDRCWSDRTLDNGTLDSGLWDSWTCCGSPVRADNDSTSPSKLRPASHLSDSQLFSAVASKQDSTSIKTDSSRFLDTESIGFGNFLLSPFTLVKVLVRVLGGHSRM
ncbi:predicted protein [Histoplasma capsulatum var. duboisii H88]|uniref:Predicted protein n=1 Tax=Ajellomyces capsulatus (strain H88) TaxID=544711 RepID=F0UCE3_AJEC8|nr:predicted protein [Histoplasma capsulatum var. duboisii H88]